ncbi:hypothetical protein QWM81_23160 [Streptomyces ficellus]|uniref:Serine/threonine protein kinase n=1 Tax=Streptomyces ficellus TaxID=1977088 RepID=A0ABT7ZCA2_9ACTN|nr:hypothetical protein [Streptomyces ficellus]MDN3296892.1 hypothetical protein [Streptomyces ficellus]
MNLRVIGLGAVVVSTALLPLAASAGPTGSPGAAVDAASSEPAPAAAPAPAVAAAAPRASAPELAAGTGAPATHSSTGATAGCGPEVASPEGVEAQTCVLTEGRDTWARTYYRNATGEELDSVLTLMAPGGRTVQTHCAVPADDEPGACETPREPSRGKPGEYSAVAEFAENGAGEESPLLLRSGSNSPVPAAS